MISPELLLNMFFLFLLGIVGFFIISIVYLIREVRKADRKTTTADYYNQKNKDKWK